MKFYLIDDSPNVLDILRIIIEERELGQVCGSAESAVDAMGDLGLLRPDIVIVDLLMPEMDGITFVKKAKKLLPGAAYVMLSQVSSKDMIADAYSSGVEFFINKPVNSIEVENVIRKVSQSLTMQRTLSQMQTLLGGGAVREEPARQQPEEQEGRIRQRAEDLLRRIGILGEAGSRDIIAVVCYMAEHPEEAFLPVSILCGKVGDTPKTVEQRIRRAAYAGLVNLANMGLDDYSSETFSEYAGTLYRFEQVRKEMNCIAGKGKEHGAVQLKNFLSAILSYSTGGHF